MLLFSVQLTLPLEININAFSINNCLGNVYCLKIYIIIYCYSPISNVYKYTSSVDYTQNGL